MSKRSGVSAGGDGEVSFYFLKPVDNQRSR